MKQPKQNNLIVKKSNDLILSKYQTSLLENKLMSISLTRLEVVDSMPRASIPASEIRRMIGAEADHNLYGKLKTASKNIIGTPIIMEDGKGNFTAFSLIIKASYINQTFKVTFNPEALQYLHALKTYTQYDLLNVLRFKSNYSFRLYEILKKDAYLISEYNPVVSVEYSYAELLYMIGLLTIQEDRAKELRNKGLTWDEIAEMEGISNVNAARWSHFRERILLKSQSEIEEKTDLCFTFDPVRTGRGGKITRITFFIKKSNNSLPDELKEYVGHNALTSEDLLVLYNESGKNLERVLSAIEMADKETYIKNYVGWLRTCIKENWKDEKITVAEGSKEKGDRLNAVQKDLFDAQKDPNGEFFVNMWERAKQRPEMQDFYAQFSFQEREYFELYNYREKIEKFFEWKRESFKAY